MNKFIGKGDDDDVKNRIVAAILVFFIIVDTLLIACAFDVSPLTIKRDVFVYEYGSEISNLPQDYVNANEEILKQVELDFSDLKNEIGRYQVAATYLGVEYPFEIEIVDTTKPVFTLKAVTFNVALNTEVYAIDLIETVEDNSEYTAYFKDKNGEIATYKIFSEKGSYVEKIFVEDNAGNESAQLRVKIVVGQNGNNPTLSGIDDVEILKDTLFDPLNGVTATDGNGNDITSKIKILKNNVDTKEEGEYELIYSVTNDKGNTLQRTRKVTVLKSKKSGD